MQYKFLLTVISFIALALLDRFAWLSQNRSFWQEHHELITIMSFQKRHENANTQNKEKNKRGAKEEVQIPSPANSTIPYCAMFKIVPTTRHLICHSSQRLSQTYYTKNFAKRFVSARLELPQDVAGTRTKVVSAVHC